MLVIKLKDNDYIGDSFKIFRDNEVCPTSFSALTDYEKALVRKALDSLNNVSLKDLELRGAIVFPSKVVEGDLKDAGKVVCIAQKLETDNPIIRTTNVMGFFSFGGSVQIEINSRFDYLDSQFFLHYILQKVCNISPTIELTHSDSNPFYEFLVYLFPSFLKKAIMQGVFRTYVSREYNDSNIRGMINFPRHFKSNIPFNGKVAYHSKEYNYDNNMTQLIRHTIEYITANKNLKNLLTLDEEIRGAVQQIMGCTETYTRASRFLIINKNMKLLSHPYYTNYEPLRKLCIMILTHDKISYGESRHNQVNGILFDGASIWEEYLNIVLQEKKIYPNLIIKHPNNRTGIGREYLFKNNKVAIYPDFIFKSEDRGTLLIADAKYKHLEEANISRDDYYQILSYLFRFKCNHGLLLYPYSFVAKRPDESLYLAGHDSEVILSVCGFEIPNYDKSTKYQDYRENMGKAEKYFVEKVKSCF